MKKYYRRKLGTCVCQNCDIEFQKPLSEIERNKKLNRSNFCSRRCVGKHNVKNFGDRSIYHYNIAKHSFNREDKYTQFRYHFRSILNRCAAKDIKINITIDDIIDVWNEQKGICEFTGVKLVLSSYSKIKKNPIYAASIDRIDSENGYVKDNIRWVSRAINWMKNNMSDELTWKLCELISENIKKRKSEITELPDCQ